MIRLLIAEDEALERKALRRLIESEFADEIEIVAECSTGRMFLDYAAELDPDLMLVDIEMPEITGLEALNALREKGIVGEALILTAYSQFEYTRMALRNQATDYLLKPVSRQDFSEAIRKSLDRISSSRRDFSRRYRYSQERELLWRLRHPGPDAKRNLEELTQVLRMKPLPFYFMSLPLEGRNGRPLLLNLKSYFNGISVDCYGAFIGNSIELLLQNEKDEGLEIRLRKELSGITKRSSDCEDLYILGPAPTLDVLSRKILESWNTKSTGSWTPGSLGRLRLEHALADDIANGHLHLIRDKLTELFFREKNLKGIRDAREYAIELATVVDRRLLSLFTFHMQRLDDLQDLIRRAGLVEEVLELLDQEFSAVSGELTNIYRTREQRLVEEVRSVLEEHPEQAFSLQEAADRLKRSKSYISRCFRNVTGLSYKEFQIFFRIELAKELLKHPGTTVSEVASATGFSDPNYFSKAFKRETGLSPTAYADGEMYK